MDVEVNLHSLIAKHIAIHEMWSYNLRDAVTKCRTGGLRPEQIGDSSACSFGMWLATDEAKLAISSYPALININFLHIEFHSCAADLLRLVSCNDKESTADMLGPSGRYTLASTGLTEALSKLADPGHERN